MYLNVNSALFCPGGSEGDPTEPAPDQQPAAEGAQGGTQGAGGPGSTRPVL